MLQNRISQEPSDAEAIVTLDLDQKRRLDLLLKALEKLGDVDAALAAAGRMERFIMIGLGHGTAPSADAARPVDGSSDGHAGPRQPAPSGALGSTKRRWTREDEQALLGLWRDDRTIEEIARGMNRTVPSVRIRARRLGLVRKRPERHEAAVLDHCSRDPRAGDRRHGRARERAHTASRANAGRRGRSTQDSAQENAWTRDPTRGPLRQAGGGGGGPLPDHGESAPLRSAITFLRSRDYSVVRQDDGSYKLDERASLSDEELIDKANTVRDRLKRPKFAV